MKVRNPQGRVDWLLAALLERQVEQSGNPLLQALHKEIKPELEQAIGATFGPKSVATRKAKELLKRISKIQQPPVKKRVKTGVKAA